MSAEQGQTVWAWIPAPPTAQDQTGRFAKVVIGAPFAEGGTAAVFRVPPEETSGQLLKIYQHAFGHEDRTSLFLKLKRMVQARPLLLANVPCAVVPDAIILSEQRPSPDTLLGCRIPLVQDAVPAEIFARAPEDLRAGEIVANATDNTLRQAALSTIIGFQQLHRAGLCFGDPNANNILIDKQTQRARFIDVDSFATPVQVKTPHGHETRFLPPPGTTPGYRSPQVIKLVRANGYARSYTQDDDCYVLAIHLFRFLVPGFHPFNASVSNAATAEEAMLKGEFPYAGPRASLGPSHQLTLFKTLPDAMRAAFVSAFADQKPPTADDWRRLFRTHWGHLRGWHA